jgi:transcriptional regulator with XRE-family HTH domain
MKANIEGLGNCIRQVRRYKGVNQSALAGACGISVSTLTHFETGKTSVGSKTLEDIIKMMNCSITIIDNDSENKFDVV